MTHSSQSANSYPVLELKTPQPRKPLGPEHTGMAGHPETPQEGSGERRKLSSGQVNPLERAGRQAPGSQVVDRAACWVTLRSHSSSLGLGLWFISPTLCVTRTVKGGKAPEAAGKSRRATRRPQTTRLR